MECLLSARQFPEGRKDRFRERDCPGTGRVTTLYLTQVKKEMGKMTEVREEENAEFASGNLNLENSVGT